jgi:DNA-binding transcriptional MerR regulator
MSKPAVVDALPALPALRADRRGYVLDGSHDGFADRPELSDAVRRRLARWAQRFTPGSVSDGQRALLVAEPESPVDDELLAAALRDAEQDVPVAVARGFYEDLTTEQLRWMREPSSHPELAGRDYPLTMGDMETLTGATARQLRHWEALGLLPAHRIDGQRRYLSAAVARAFALKESQQHEIAALGALAGGGEDAARFVRLVAAQVGSLAGRIPGGDGDELADAAATIVRLSARLVDDEGSGQATVRKPPARQRRPPVARRRAKS